MLILLNSNEQILLNLNGKIYYFMIMHCQQWWIDKREIAQQKEKSIITWAFVSLATCEVSACIYTESTISNCCILVCYLNREMQLQPKQFKWKTNDCGLSEQPVWEVIYVLWILQPLLFSLNHVLEYRVFVLAYPAISSCPLKLKHGFHAEKESNLLSSHLASTLAPPTSNQTYYHRHLGQLHIHLWDTKHVGLNPFITKNYRKK